MSDDKITRAKVVSSFQRTTMNSRFFQEKNVFLLPLDYINWSLNGHLTGLNQMWFSLECRWNGTQSRHFYYPFNIMKHTSNEIEVDLMQKKCITWHVTQDMTIINTIKSEIIIIIRFETCYTRRSQSYKLSIYQDVLMEKSYKCSFWCEAQFLSVECCSYYD